MLVKQRGCRDLKSLKAVAITRSAAMLLPSSASRSEDDPDPCPDLEAAAANTAATANIAMHPVTGAFANPSHETAFAAQLFRMAFPCHLFLMALTDAIMIWSSLSAPPDLLPLESMIAFLGTLCLVGRVLVHRKYTHTRASVESTMAHQSMDDTVRGQRLGSWTWIAILALVVSIDLIGYVVAPAADCAFQRTHNLAGFAGLTIALVNGSYGLGFWRKLGLIGIYMLHDGVCSDMVSESLLVVGVVVAHMAEMHLRHIYVEKQRQAEDKQRLEERTDEESRRLEERMEQLQAEKERLLYDVQRRGRPLDDDDDRSAIRRGLQAKPSRQPPTSDGDTTSSDRSGAKPSPDSPPPSLPPGPPSSASSGTTAPPYTWAKPTAPPPTVAELVARQEVAHVLLSCARGQTSHQCLMVVAQPHRIWDPSALQARFNALVMCNFTPRNPSELPPSRWVSYDTLFRLFEPYARAEVWQVGPGNLKQLITKWFQGHPVFAGLVPSVWCKRMSEEGRCIYKFSFEYTPR